MRLHDRIQLLDRKLNRGLLQLRSVISAVERSDIPDVYKQSLIAAYEELKAASEVMRPEV